MKSRTKEAIAAIEEWYASLALYQDKLPSKGTIAAALIVLGRLRETLDLDIASHVAAGKAQIMGLSNSAVVKILKEFGETRKLSTEGGRSNRGARGDVEALLQCLDALELGNLASSDRDLVLKSMQQHIVSEFVPRYFAVKRVRARACEESCVRNAVWV